MYMYNTYMYIRLHDMLDNTHTQYTHTYIHTYTRTHTRTHTNMHTCTQTSRYMMYIYMCMYVFERNVHVYRVAKMHRVS